jgi:hypothetical protein
MSTIQIIKSADLPVADLDKDGWWVILDATDSPNVPLLTQYSEVEIMCLYKGEAAESMADIAPYLVKLDVFMYHWIKDNIWQEPWGIAFQSSASIEDLHRHLRKFLMVRDEAGKLMWFRYYDPRVLPTFLESCTEDELKKFCGPIHTYWCQQGEGFCKINSEIEI